MSPAAVLAWAAAQVGALTLALLQVPLAAQYPTGSGLALEVVSAAQVGGAALLSPLLFRTPATAAVVLGSAWPALLLAGGVAARPPGQTALCGLAVSAWLATLFLWTSAYPSRRCRQVVAAAATLFAVGGALLAYLATEFAPPGGPEFSRPAVLRATPLLLAWSLGGPATSMWSDAFVLGILLVGGAGVWFGRQSRRRRARGESGSCPFA